MMAVVLLTAMLAQQPLHLGQFANSAPGEGVAVITASCDRCDWGAEGREAAALRISLDGRYSQHLLLVRGVEPVRLAQGLVEDALERGGARLDDALGLLEPSGIRERLHGGCDLGVGVVAAGGH